MAAVTNQLSRVAKAAADDAGLGLDVSAQTYLGELVSGAAEYLVEHPDEPIEKAEQSLQRYAVQLAKWQERRTAQTLLPTRPDKLSADDLHLAAVRMCPGFWPFC
jgi:hypothetical protein